MTPIEAMTKVPRAMLIGSPRSGTTWLAKIVDSHPSVLYRHEPDTVSARPDIPFVPEADEVLPHVRACRDYLDVLFQERAGKSAGSQPMFDKDYRSTTSEQTRRLLIYGLKAAERLLPASKRLFHTQIPDLARTGAAGPGLMFFKSVSSLCRARMFSLADPDLKTVQIIRHPCAYVASTLRGKQLGLLEDDAYIETLAAMSQAQRHGLSLETLRDMSREQQLAIRWMLQNDKVVEEMEDNDNYHRVIYEELCNDPQGVADKLIGFLGLDMREQVREFIAESSAGKASEPRYFDVRRDSASAATGWTRELSETQIEQIASVVRPSRVGRLYYDD